MIEIKSKVYKNEINLDKIPGLEKMKYSRLKDM